MYVTAYGFFTVSVLFNGGWTLIFSCFNDRCLFDITAFRNVEWRNLLLTVSLGFIHPLGPIISALRAPSLASSSKASTASLWHNYIHLYNSKITNNWIGEILQQEDIRNLVYKSIDINLNGMLIHISNHY